MQPLLNVSHLSGGYEMPVLHDVTMQVNAGELVALLGPNGAGKSTFLKCLSGTAQWVRGTMSLQDRDLARTPAHRRAAIGLVHVPQGRRIFRSLTVEENLRVGAVSSRVSRDESRRRIAECFELFPVLGKMKDRPGIMLSGGQQQMLAVARGLMAKPKLLLLDEPSIGLAPSVVNELFQRLKDVRQQQGTAFLVVEQRVAEALRLVDSVYVLVAGRTVIERRPPSSLSDGDLATAYLGGEARRVSS